MDMLEKWADEKLSAGPSDDTPDGIIDALAAYRVLCDELAASNHPDASEVASAYRQAIIALGRLKMVSQEALQKGRGTRLTP